jgi:Predicted transcriptional regulators
MNIGVRIKEARLAANMTQEELAKKIGVSKNAISNYENGVSTPKVELLCAIMKHLEIDANFLYGLPHEEVPQLRLTPHERDVIIAYRSHPELQAAVDRVLLLESDKQPQPKQA